ncbi:MAG: 23S rRNA (pseudouridine(1915)-N(3))-methyltransferase RlmH, partial [Thermodesulfobacteriota bacterium]
FAAEDGELLMASVPGGARKVALAPDGRQFASEELAALLGRWGDQGVREVAFLIGGPCGLPARLVREADLALSLSRMTFTHEMARLLLLEQLYRAFSIRAGSGYHK